MAEPDIIFESVGIRFGSRQILQGIDANIEPGEFVGIFGPNGAGKSTLVSALLGLCPISSGKIVVLGKEPEASRSKIGYMPQSRSPFEGAALSARSMVAAVRGGCRWGLPWETRADREEVNRALYEAGAETYAARPFNLLSGGEKQRITLAQALLGNPQILILDEPLASLDPKNQGLLVEHIRDISRKNGTTVLFIAHDLNPLLHCMSRVWYLANGRSRIGRVSDVVNSESLSNLYGSRIDVVEAAGRVFVLNAENHVTEAARHA